jgi:hypothetical protein
MTRVTSYSTDAGRLEVARRDEAILEAAGMIRRASSDPRPGYDLDLTATEIAPDQKLLPAPKGGDDVDA